MSELTPRDGCPDPPSHPFPDLADEIAGLQAQLAQWQVFESVYQQRLHGRLQPLLDQLRRARIALVELLDRASRDPALPRRVRPALRQALLRELADLLEEGQEPVLLALQAFHGEPAPSHDDAPRKVDPPGAEDATPIASDPDADAQAISDAAEADWQQRAAEAQAARAGRTRARKGRKARAADAAREEAERTATQSLREVYRRLAMALHPDREPDAERRARKNELMRDVNQAYAARDLLSLLALQLQIAQIDHATLARLSPARLDAYRQVLREQAARLRSELQALQRPYLASMPGVAPARLTPERVLRALEDDVRAVREALQAVEADLLDLRDPEVLAARLGARGRGRKS